jgi:hypothetical protein
MCGKIGVGFGALATGNNVWKNDISWPGPDALAATPAASDVATWLRDVGKLFSGSEVRMVTENTAPSAAIQALVREEFTPATGIKVAMELLPLEHVLQKIGMDITHAAALYDLYYLDQSWIARFADGTEDPRDLYAHSAELAMPGYDMYAYLSEQMVATADEQILARAAEAAGEGRGIVTRTPDGIERLESALRLRSRVDQLVNVLVEAARSSEAGIIDLNAEQFSVILEEAYDYLESMPENREVQALRASINTMRDIGNGANSIFALRQSELTDRQYAHTLQEESQAIADGLSLIA